MGIGTALAFGYWFTRFCRLAIRYECRADVLQALHELAAAVICWRFVERWRA